MGKKFEVEVTVPEGAKPGETFKIEVEVPTKPAQPRGILAGIPLEEMDLDQLKREKTNASSVLYKAQKRGADQAIIDKNQERLNAVLAMIEKKRPAPVVATAEVKEGENKLAPKDGGKKHEDKKLNTEI